MSDKTMKPPDEIKKGLNVCGTLDGDCDNCAYAGFKVFCTDRLRQDALTYIQQLEASYSQVSKALCGKENAALGEVLQVINQVTPRTFAIPPRSGKALAFQLSQRIAKLEQELATVKRERDAAVFALHGNCDECRWQDTAKCASCIYGIDAWDTHDDCWEWDGVCPENTEV